MSYLEQIQRGVDHLEARLDQDLSLREVSRAAGMSHWHFQRIFKALTGHTLMSYLRARRLSRAFDDLLRTGDRVLDIALRSGFSSQEAFTRAFSAAFGVTPARCRKMGGVSPFPKKLELDGEFVRHLARGVPLEPEVTPAGTRTMVGIRTRYYGASSEKNNIASTLPPLWDDFLARAHEIPDARDGLMYGVLAPADDDSARLDYVAAVEVHTDVDRTTRVPAGMVSIVVPAAPYATFRHIGPSADLDHTVSYIYGSWLARSGRRHSCGPDLEIYGDEWSATSAESMMRYAVPLV